MLVVVWKLIFVVLKNLGEFGFEYGFNDILDYTSILFFDRIMSFLSTETKNIYFDFTMAAFVEVIRKASKIPIHPHNGHIKVNKDNFGKIWGFAVDYLKIDCIQTIVCTSIFAAKTCLSIVFFVATKDKLRRHRPTLP